jgi:hypothetical protein
LAAVVSASESDDDDDDDEGLVAYGSAVFRRTLRGRQRSHSDVGFCTWPTVHKSNFCGASTPSTRRQLDGVPMCLHHR